MDALDTMLAAVYHGRHDVRLEQVARPFPGPGELLLRFAPQPYARPICASSTMATLRSRRALSASWATS